MASGLLDEPARQELTAMMQRQLSHLVRLLVDLLDTVRVATGQLQAKREPVHLLEVIRTAIESVRPAIHAKHQTLQQTALNEPMVVDADPVRLCQAFAFPIRNWRLQNGLAIGLGLVKGLLELNEGSAAVGPAADAVGLVYTVRLPVSSHQVVAPAAAGERSHQGWRSQRMLVVDDNRDAAATLGMLLELDGHTVRIAHDGPSAVAEAKEWQPDLILMDLGLPVFSGLEASRRIRSSAPATRPIIHRADWMGHRRRPGGNAGSRL